MIFIWGLELAERRWRLSSRSMVLGEKINEETRHSYVFEMTLSNTPPPPLRCPQLRHEYKVYRELANAPGFAKVHYFGTQDSYNLMVMDLLGPSLEDQFNKCGRRFNLKTVLMIADQMLERVELMHSRHLIHRDIKPGDRKLYFKQHIKRKRTNTNIVIPFTANFVTDITGSPSKNTIYCIDFGLSKRYRHPRTLQHIPAREGRSLTGTPRYASINNHLGVEQSRRDDLESIGYVLVYFLKGGLPWQGLKVSELSVARTNVRISPRRSPCFPAPRSSVAKAKSVSPRSVLLFFFFSSNLTHTKQTKTHTHRSNTLKQNATSSAT